MVVPLRLVQWFFACVAGAGAVVVLLVKFLFWLYHWCLGSSCVAGAGSIPVQWLCWLCCCAIMQCSLWNVVIFGSFQNHTENGNCLERGKRMPGCWEGEGGGVAKYLV